MRIVWIQSLALLQCPSNISALGVEAPQASPIHQTHTQGPAGSLCGWGHTPGLGAASQVKPKAHRHKETPLLGGQKVSSHPAVCLTQSTIHCNHGLSLKHQHRIQESFLPELAKLVTASTGLTKNLNWKNTAPENHTKHWGWAAGQSLTDHLLLNRTTDKWFQKWLTEKKLA